MKSNDSELQADLRRAYEHVLIAIGIAIRLERNSVANEVTLKVQPSFMTMLDTFLSLPTPSGVAPEELLEVRRQVYTEVSGLLDVDTFLRSVTLEEQSATIQELLRLFKIASGDLVSVGKDAHSG